MLGGIRANPYLIDAIIGFSVAYKAFENMDGFKRFFGVQPNTRVAVLVFGLFHGFGLATKLQEFELSPNGLVANIVSFNVGVEIGQGLALTFILIALSYWRTRSGFMHSRLRDECDRHGVRFPAGGLSALRLLPRSVTTMSTANDQTVEARHRILVAAGAALLAAGLILVMFVLPAEYARRSTRHRRARRPARPWRGGTAGGSALQRRGDAGAGGEAPIVVPQDRAFKQETVEFKVASARGMEYKYRLEKGEALLYSWKTTAPVNFEFHAEPDGAPRGYAQTYEKADRQSEASGTLNAPFSGIHGWYWENTTDQEITVTLTSAGYYNLSHEFRSGQPTKNKTF